MTEIRTTGSRLVYENRWLRVREDRIERPDGSPGLYTVVEKLDFSLVVPVDADGFHLIEQYRYPVRGRYWEFPQGTWDEPGGRSPGGGSGGAGSRDRPERRLHAAPGPHLRRVRPDRSALPRLRRHRPHARSTPPRSGGTRAPSPPCTIRRLPADGPPRRGAGCRLDRGLHPPAPPPASFLRSRRASRSGDAARSRVMIGGRMPDLDRLSPVPPTRDPREDARRVRCPKEVVTARIRMRGRVRRVRRGARRRRHGPCGTDGPAGPAWVSGQ